MSSWDTGNAAELLGLFERAVDVAVADPLSCVPWTKPQHEWLSLDAPRKLLRAGNQIGKTWAGLAEVIFRCIGRHPFLSVRRPPIEAWIVCTSWQQSVAIMGKFHELCADSFIDHKQSSNFSRKNGYGKENPTVVFREEWGGSIVRFKTTMQGASAVASGTIDLVLVDEPPTEDVYRELASRVRRRGGTILITLTPINNPCGWLKQLVADGVVQEVHAKLLPENLIPHGLATPLYSDGAPMDAAWIAEQRRITPPSIADVVLDGEWEARFVGAWLKCFSRDRHVGDYTFDPSRGQTRWVVGIDYSSATREAGQVAVLARVQERRDERGRARFYVLAVDEVVEDGVVTNEDFAGQMLTMLGRHGLRWVDVWQAHGDNPVRGRYGVERSNIETRKALAREIGVSPEGLLPRILSAKDGDGATMYDVSCRWLYERFATDEAMVHRRCARLIEACETWDGSRDHPAKDRIDALRYALKPFAMRYPGRSGAVSLRIG